MPKDEVVIRPDHPLLLRSPDALVGGDANLCAIFTPQRLEEGNPAHLASRLIAARLALPGHCRTLLLLRDDQEDRVAKLSEQFGLVAGTNDKAFGSFIRDRDDFGASRPMSSEIQERANRVFEIALYVSENAYRNSRVVSHTPEPRGRLSATREVVGIHSGSVSYTPRNRVRFDKGLASILTARDRSGLLRQIILVASGHLLESFQLDQGIPYPRYERPHLAIASDADELLDVRGKTIYGAAFAGVSVIPNENAEVIENAFERSDQLVSSRRL
jgi:hypothetical protein